eukprot:CAMPEP_0175228324 /NCGR_PEP_ID=MMETSP0093-20121207/23860_1 /TAXON_ID=311494 /ORGANISM="Alexandrium monilatum, Strain CCMP3105" /LENGTH=42 /DNA_ID= /DNA_START= /DNA_END= /DNA_ORIENTATION=
MQQIALAGAERLASTGGASPLAAGAFAPLGPVIDEDLPAHEL